MIAMTTTIASHAGAQNNTATNAIKPQPLQAKEADKKSGHSIDAEEQDSIDFVSPEHQDNLVPRDQTKDHYFAHFLAPEANATDTATTTKVPTSLLADNSASVRGSVNPVELSHQQSPSISLLQAVKHQTQATETSAIERHVNQLNTSATDAVKANVTKLASGEMFSPEMKVMNTTQKLSTVVLLDKLTSANLNDNKPVDVASLRIEQQIADINSPERLMTQATQGRHEWSAVKMESQQNAWSKQLFNVLQDRIEMQVHQNIKQANIRLDPPDLGRLDVSVRMDGDRLTVMINTSNSAIREALQASLQQLRSELSNQFGAGVDVNVGGGSGEKEFQEREHNVALSSSEEQEENVTLLPIEQRGLFNTLV
ncbi:flagellar hook-length control protein FliK [Moritella yayanosii]|uniref:Putative flagellar hook-length control protein fliK/LafE n=1 Tax=Moritella yayanosii TaxID=69539 RepID=A0A330LPR8_9GAMM|nr:flagellar hook-length control protein FliK [Moritella yayanosii]SQD78639.1 putative flagellar hook-length control protein fliK/LafE [Moritella yayanosii]